MKKEARPVPWSTSDLAKEGSVGNPDSEPDAKSASNALKLG
jgi:hypothetical protein